MSKLVCDLSNGDVSTQEYSFEELQEQQSNYQRYLAKLPILARQERDALLSATDWTQAADVPQAIKDKWAPYRQALRDVTSQEGFPWTVTWPEAP
jgi:hypothetical protein